MGKIGNLIYSTFSTKDKVEIYQKKIRDKEWKEVLKYIPLNCSFLDVGCGAGYAMHNAKKDRGATVCGIDPSPFKHGVGRYVETIFQKQQITQGIAENLPYKNNEFDIVYSSHVLEHVNSEVDTLAEMKRVLKADGTLIISVPTSTMAIINWFSTILFSTHIKIYEFFRKVFSKEAFIYFMRIFRVESHSKPIANSIFYDFFHYREKKWKKTIEKQFHIEKKISPYLYPYPDYWQWFPFHSNPFFSSSVIFICRKK